MSMERRMIDFFNQLNVSDRTKRNYESALNSRFIKQYLKDLYGIGSIFEITKLEQLWDFYCKINLHPTNIANHRGYSCAIMRYIRFLNDGKKYGRRIDADKKKPRKKRTKKENKS